MEELSIFKNIEEKDINKMLNCFGAETKKYQKDDIILSNMSNTNLIGVVLSGYANMIKYDYNGNRTIIESLEHDSIFGKPFSYLDNEVSVVATTDCEVLLMEYNCLIKRCKKNCVCHSMITDNVLDLLRDKIMELNERLEVLSKRSIREKVLCYLSLVAKKKRKNIFYLPLTYTELADYLSVDRSAMMREIKKLKDQGMISSNGKRLKLNN